jgi:hypothetical protein
MKRFKALQTYLLFILILSVFLIIGCGGGGGETGHWLPSNAPTVTSTNLADLATGVCVNKIITATFSKAMDDSTITAAGTFTVKETVTGNNVPGVVTYNATTKTATFTRTANFTAGLNYTATITTAAKDTDGNALADDKVWSFTVAAGLCENETTETESSGSCDAGALPLASATNFAVLAGTALTLSNPQSITGHVGSPSITPAGGPSTLIGTMYDSSPASELTVISTAVTDMETAVACANARACDFNYAGATDFASVVGLAPGVHCVTGAMSVGSNLTLSTPGVYIFRSTGALTSANTITMAYGGSANVANSSVFWVSSGAASGVSIGATNTFLGTIMCSPCAAGATIQANTTLIPGRVLSSAAVTLGGTNTITIP